MKRKVTDKKMEVSESLKMEEFRSNLLLLLQCGYPEGLPMSQLKPEYKQYFQEDVSPELILPRGYKNNKHWDTLFQMKEFREDFTLFYMGTAVYVKAIRKRHFAEMKLIAQLAKHSHLNLVRADQFRCGCCAPELWKSVARDVAVIGGSALVGNCASPRAPLLNQQGHQQLQHHGNNHHHQGTEDGHVMVKVEPQNHHQHLAGMVNGGHQGDDGGGVTRGGGPSSSDGGIYSLVQQDPRTTPSTTTSSSTSISDSSPASLQAFNALLNSSGAGGGPSSLLNHAPSSDGSSSSTGGPGQPFYTFVIQNGEIKVMQIVSSEGNNGDATTTTTAVPLPSPTIPPVAAPAVGRKSLPQQKRNSTTNNTPTPPSTNSTELICSMPGCGETFEVKQHLQNHERTCLIKKYPCSFPGCDRRFKNSKQRHAHMTSRHRGTENSFRCTVPSCTAVFKTIDRLKVHESRCRFKYEQFQLMELDDIANGVVSASSNLASAVPVAAPSGQEEQPPVNAPFPPQLMVQQHQSTQDPVKVEQHETIQLHAGSAGFSTVDLSLVKAEVME